MLACLFRLRSWKHPAYLPPRGASSRDPLGPWGERLAARFLKQNGYRVRAMNLRFKHGEIDIVAIAPDQRTIVVVEVKARRVSESSHQPPPEAAITAHKSRQLLMLTHKLLSANKWTERPARIDVIAIDWPLDLEARPKLRPVIRHHQAAVAPPA